MMQFTSGKLLIAQMKKDLLSRTFPHLLMNLATGSKVQLAAMLADAAVKYRGKAPPLQMVISKVPPPGHATVATTYMASETPGDDGQKSLAEAKAYKDTVRRFHKDRLGSKALVLKLLASVGVS